MRGFNDALLPDCCMPHTSSYGDAQGQTVLERHDLSCTFLNHDELESINGSYNCYFVHVGVNLNCSQAMCTELFRDC